MKTIESRIILLLFFLFSLAYCSPHPLNRSIGFKKLQLDTSNKPDLFIEDFKLYLNRYNFNDAQVKPIYVENLKRALVISLHNSGKFKEITFDNNYDKKNCTLVSIFLTAKSVSKFYQYPLTKYNEEFSLLFFPNDNIDPDGNSYFWPPFLIILPYAGVSPLTPKAGRIEVKIELQFNDGKKIKNISLTESEKFATMLYGLYRIDFIEDLFPILYSKILEKLTIRLLDF